MTHDPWPPLDDRFRAPDAEGTWADCGAHTWTREFGEWEGYWPPDGAASRGFGFGGTWLCDTERWHFLSTEMDPRDVEYE